MNRYYNKFFNFLKRWDDNWTAVIKPNQVNY